MNRDEFLNELMKYLSGLSENDKNDTISFYSNYFDEQMAAGRSEKEIIDELGSPRLLAKSIKDTKEAESASYSNYSHVESGNTESGTEYHFYDFKQVGWKNKILAALILVLVIVLIATLIAGVVTLFVKIVIPVLVILAIVGIIKNLFNR